jgi:DNA-binding MltR family transcriptional regulator
MSKFTDQNINNMIDELMSEKNTLMTELKNDKEMKHYQLLVQKMGLMDTMVKSMIKYRNVITKAKLKADL